MKKLVLALFAICLLGHVSAQLSYSLQYNYLQAKEWDDMVRAYNFNRPWQENAQPFITNGYGGSIGYYFLLKRRQSLYLHPRISFDRFSCKAENDEQLLGIQIDHFQLQTDLHFNPKALFHDVSAGPIGTRWFITVSPGVDYFFPRINRNGEKVYVSEDEVYQPKSLTWFAELGTGFRALYLANRWVITPFFRARYYRKLAIEDFQEEAFGADTGEFDSVSMNNWQFQAGIEWTTIFKKK